MASKRPALPSQPLWYKDAILYELHVRAFYDSAGDGIGDFGGLARKLDYLQDLGVTAIWLLPFYPSPLKDDGYDTADYTNVHPAYGTLRDFRTFLREAHARGLRVITELVLNHTSDQHPWFQRARAAAPGSAFRNFYVWSDTPERYKDARIIFKDFEPSNWTWDRVAGAYYWHRFYAHQPDLNWESPQVRRTLVQVIDFWLGEMGVDGLRLDAVPYLFEREGTNCENLPETHAALKELRAHVEARHADKMLLAEANQWPEDAAAYFGAGDECHTAFHFPLMPRLFMGIHLEDRYPIVDMLEQTPPIPETCQWVLFLRNHDELTLEMVTDEERDYMYRNYAQDVQARINLGIRRRLAPLLGNNRRKIELMNALLLSLPGTPVLYYGDEIGMGDNFYLGDRNGVRTPMQWSPDRNAGFSRGTPQRLYLPVIIDPEYHFEAINVEVQQNNPQSLLWWMKRIFSLRRQHKAFGRGTIQLVQPDNHKVLAFVRAWEDERILVVANLSRFSQHAELNLGPFKGLRPVEMFGRSAFPPIGDVPYSLSLGPHGFLWFVLEAAAPLTAQAAHTAQVAPAALPTAAPTLAWSEQWEERFAEKTPDRIAPVLTEILAERVWFWGKARPILRSEVVESLEITPAAALTLVQVDYAEGEPDTYLLPIGVLKGRRAEDLATRHPHAVLARLVGDDGAPFGVLFDALWDRDFAEEILNVLARRAGRPGMAGELEGWTDRQIRRSRPPLAEPATHHIVVQQGDATVVFGSRFALRLVRRPEEEHPDLEVAQYLTARGFSGIPHVRGVLTYRSPTAARTLGVLQDYVPHETDGWNLALDELGRFAERVLTSRSSLAPAPPLLVDLEASTLPAEARDALGPFLPHVEVLARRTGEFHLALGSDTTDPRFAPEPFSALYQRSLIQSLRNVARQALSQLRRRARHLPADVQADVQRVLQLEGEILSRARSSFQTRFAYRRIRCHGNYHLGRVLFTGKDFVILLFEGEPARNLGERRIKRSPLRDVASMMRSFHYVSAHALSGRVTSGAVRSEDLPVLEPALRAWRTWASTAFLQGYLRTIQGAPFAPASTEELRASLTAFLLEKTLYEIAYEVAQRPDWVRIPLGELLELMERK